VSRGEVVIVNRLGLHARAAAKFVQLASRYRSSIRVSVGERVRDGKSILGLLLLAASYGTRVTIEADGTDDADALRELVALVARGFEDPT
jgi:phosphocarrier protein HPr